jgi:hypothetical protein
MVDGDDCRAIGGMNEWQGKPQYLEKTCPIAALSTTDATWLEQGSNPGRRSGKLATTSLCYGTNPAFYNSNICIETYRSRTFVHKFPRMFQYLDNLIVEQFRGKVF